MADTFKKLLSAQSTEQKQTTAPSSFKSLLGKTGITPKTDELTFGQKIVRNVKSNVGSFVSDLEKSGENVLKQQDAMREEKALNKQRREIEKMNKGVMGVEQPNETQQSALQRLEELTGEKFTLDDLTPKTYQPKVKFGDFVKALPSAAGSVLNDAAKNFASAFVEVPMSLIDTPGVLSGKEPLPTVNLPWLGEVGSHQRQALDAIRAGEDPTVAMLRVGGESILDVLTVYSVVKSLIPKKVEVKPAITDVPKDKTTLYKNFGGEKGAMAKQVQGVGGDPTVGQGTYYSYDSQSAAHFGDMQQRFMLDRGLRIYDAAKPSTKGFSNLYKDPMYREMLKSGGDDLVQFLNSRGYDGVRFWSDTADGVWLALKPGMQVEQFTPQAAEYAYQLVNANKAALTPIVGQLAGQQITEADKKNIFSRTLNTTKTSIANGAKKAWDWFTSEKRRQKRIDRKTRQDERELQMFNLMYGTDFETLKEAKMSSPLMQALNSQQGQAVIGTIGEETSNLFVKGVARLESIGAQTYGEALDKWLEKRYDPENTGLEKFLFNLQDSGPQSLLGVILAVGATAATRDPRVGNAIGGSYFAAISANEQLQETGEISNLNKIAIDTVGDLVLSNALTGLFKQSAKNIAAELVKLGFVEGSTEVSQSLLKYADEYQKARSIEEQNAIVERAKQYVKEEMLMEFGVGFTIGVVATGGARATGISGTGVDATISQNTTNNIVRSRATVSPEQAAEIAEVIEQDVADALETVPARDVAQRLQDDLGFTEGEANAVVDSVISRIIGDVQSQINTEINLDGTQDVLSIIEGFAERQAADGTTALQQQIADLDARIQQGEVSAEIQARRDALQAELDQLTQGEPQAEADLMTEEIAMAEPEAQIPEEPRVGSIVDVPIEQVESGLLPQIEERINRDDPKIRGLVAAIQRGDAVPPVPVFVLPGGRFQLNKDGNHRLAAYRFAGVQTIPVEIQEKTTKKAAAKQQEERAKARRQAVERTALEAGSEEAFLKRLEANEKFNQENAEAIERGEVVARPTLTDVVTDEAFAPVISNEPTVNREQAVKTLQAYKKRFNLDFDVNFADVIFTGESNRPTAWGVTYDNTITLTENVTRTTADHEFVHLVFYNLNKLKDTFNVTRRELLEELNGGPVDMSNAKLVEDLGEDLAIGFEDYVAKRRTFTGKIRAFFEKLLRELRKLFQLGNDVNVIDRFYDNLFNAKRAGETVVLVPQGKLADITEDGVVDFGKLPPEEVPAFQKKQRDLSALVEKVNNDNNKLTSKFFTLKDIEGRKMLSKSLVENLLRSKTAGLKAAEIRIIKEVMAEKYADQNKFEANQFKQDVMDAMLPVSIIETDSYANYGTENIGFDYRVGDVKTYLLNTPYEHGKTGHFPSDFRSAVNVDNVSIVEIPISDQNPTTKYAVVYKHDELTRDNIEESVYTVTNSRQAAEAWITNHTPTENGDIEFYDKGLFSHFRAWNDGDTSYIAEIQSDSFQGDKLESLSKKIAVRQEAYDSLRVEQVARESYVIVANKWLDHRNGKIILEEDWNKLEEKARKDVAEDKVVSRSEFGFAQTYTREDADRNATAMKEGLASEIKSLKAQQTNVLEPKFFDYEDIWQERTVREAIRIKALEGFDAVRFPTPRTVATIEGYQGGEGGDLIPYQHDGDRETDLEVGDTIEYLGEEHTVVQADAYNITVARSEKVQQFDYDSYVEDDINGQWEDAVYEFESLQEDLGKISTGNEAVAARDAIDTYNRQVNFLNKQKDIRSQEERNADNPTTYGERRLAEIKERKAVPKKELAALPEFFKKKLQESEPRTYYVGNGEGILKWHIALAEDLGDFDADIDISDIEDSWKEDYSRNYDPDFEGMYGEGSVFYSERNGRTDEVFIVEDAETETLQQPSEYEEAASIEDFDINDFDNEQKTVLMFYDRQVNKYLRKYRGDNLELVEDNNGYQWLETQITDEDRGPIAAFQRVPGDDAARRAYQKIIESSQFTELSEKLAEAQSQIEVEFEIAEAGSRQVIGEGADRRVIGIPSTFPKWIPEGKLRNKQLMNTVLEKMQKGETLRGTNQKRLQALIEEQVANRIPDHLWQEKLINDWIIEQEAKRADERSAFLASMKKFVQSLPTQRTVEGRAVKTQVLDTTGQRQDEAYKLLKKQIRAQARTAKEVIVEGRKQVREKLRKDRERKNVINEVKRHYAVTKRAIRTGKGIDLEYQKRLLALFAQYDFAKMTDKTKQSLEKTRDFFANEPGEAPKIVAAKLERLSKTALGDMTTEQIQELDETISEIIHLGRVKYTLKQSQNERQLRATINRVLQTTVNPDRNNGPITKFAKAIGVEDPARINFNTLEPFRVADILDGYRGYTGGNFVELIEPMREAVNQARLQSEQELSTAFDQIQEITDTYSKDQQRRMVYQSALDQGGEQQAQALRKAYPDTDFDTPLTEEEQKALDIMRDSFKRVRTSVAATYESTKNMEFPDIPNYFPYKYDKDINVFDVVDQPFDFNQTKTAQGFTVARTPGVNKVLDTDIFAVFAKAISEQLYYAHVQPQLDLVKAVVNDNAYQAQAGVSANRFWSTFIEDVARRGNPGGWFDMLRGNISTAVLGYKLTTILIQPLAVVDAMSTLTQEFGVATALKVLPNLAKMTYSYDTLRAAKEESASLGTRAGGQVEISDIKGLTAGSLSRNPFARGYNTFKRHAFDGIQAVDMRAAAAVYKTFKDTYIKKGMSEAEAIRRAEQMMIMTQASANVVDRAHLFNTALGRGLLTFQTFVANAFNNVRHDIIASNFANKGLVKGAMQAVWALQFVVYARLAEEWFRDAFFRLWYGGDEEDKTIAARAWEIFITNVPILNNFFGFDGEFLRGEIRNPIIDVVKKGGGAIDRIINRREITIDDAAQVIQQTAAVTGVPGSSQMMQLIKADFLPIRDALGFKDYETRRQKIQEAYKAFEKKKVSEAGAIDQVIADYYGEEGASDQVRNNIRKEFAVYKAYGTDNKYANAILAATSNNDKLEVLQAARKDLGQAEFARFYQKGRKKITLESGSLSPILISDNLDEMYREL